MTYLVAPEHFAGDGFVLRSYRSGDGAALRAATLASYEHLKTFMPWAVPEQSEAQAEQLVRQFRGRWLLAEDFVIGVFSPDETELWGGTGFHLREGGLDAANAEIGMWIHTDRAGRGLGTRCLAAMLEWGFTEWPWQRLSWRCDATNVASIRVAEKVGMQREGTLRSHMFAAPGQHLDGPRQRRDTVCFASLCSDDRFK